jgi:hypothetical protein
MATSFEKFLGGVQVMGNVCARSLASTPQRLQRRSRLAIALVLLYLAKKLLGPTLLSILLRLHNVRTAETPRLIYRKTPDNKKLLSYCVTMSTLAIVDSTMSELVVTSLLLQLKPSTILHGVYSTDTCRRSSSRRTSEGRRSPTSGNFWTCRTAGSSRWTGHYFLDTHRTRRMFRLLRWPRRGSRGWILRAAQSCCYRD